ncbi:chemotaxis protein MotB [Gammaproteobacteria bacterium]
MDTSATKPASVQLSAKSTPQPKPTATRSLRPIRRRQVAEDDLDAWLMSFADLITLMLGFFVVLYAASRIDAYKAEQIKESLAKTLIKNTTLSQPVVKQVGYDDLIKEIQHELSAMGLEKLAHVQLVSSGVALTAAGDLLFASGSAEMTPPATTLLNSISIFVARLPYAIRIEGHTDDIPIRTQQFPSNWELSAARAGRVARFLIDHGIAPNRLAVTGYADTRPLLPIVGSTEAERRAANRRVVFLFEKIAKTIK